MEWKRKKVVYHKKKRKSEDFVAWQFLLPGFSGVCIFVLVPFADTIRRSFINNVTGKWIGFTSYQLILSNQMFLLATKNTVRFFVISLPILMVLSFLLTIVVKKNLPKHPMPFVLGRNCSLKNWKCKNLSYINHNSIKALKQMLSV